MIGRFQPSNNHKKFDEDTELEDEDYPIREPDQAE
tara:strand:+ start:251 stop:355 length:105 start_codon:yes stop_codon:yes gene_type:complete